jgi:hypothetical protein
MRTCIYGGPRTGKTTLALALGEERNAMKADDDGTWHPAKVTRVRHTDDLMSGLAWSEVSQKIADQWLTEPGPWIIEGVACARALRKWLRANPEGKPCDEVILLWSPHVELTSGQASMAKGCRKVWLEIAGQLKARGVAIR